MHFDARCDTGPELFGHKHHHGGPFRCAVEDGALDPKRTIQIGIRGPSEPLWAFRYAFGMTVIRCKPLAPPRPPSPAELAMTSPPSDTDGINRGWVLLSAGPIVRELHVSIRRQVRQ